MNQVEQQNLAPGMILAKSIFRDNGKLLFPCGYVMTRPMITQLKKLDRPYFWMHDPHTHPFISEDLIFQQIAFQSNNSTGLTNGSAQDSEKDESGVITALENAPHYSKIFMTARVKKLVGQVLDKIISGSSILTNLKILKARDYYSFQNSVDVTTCAIAFARQMKMSKAAIEKMAVGSLLKELGMVVIPKEIVSKNSRDLTFAESLIYQEHPSYGFAILTANKEISRVSAEVVLQHHERQDSAGFPQKLRGHNKKPEGTLKSRPGYIHPYAEIVSICDAYVSMISPRPGGPLPKTPAHVRRILGTAAGSQLNRGLVDIFTTLIPEFPEGTKILARDSRGTYTGYLGYVLKSNPETVHYPTIVLTESPDHQQIDPVKIDLQQNRNVEIQILLK